MRVLLALLAVFLFAGCISAPSSPLESVAAESPPDAQAYAYLDTRTLATNQHVLDALTDEQVPALIGHLLIVAPEGRIIVHDGGYVIGFKTLGPGFVAQFATPLAGDYEQKTHLGKTYFAGDPSVFARMGEIYIGDEEVLKKVIEARSGANAVVPHSQLIKKVPKGDVMLVADTGIMVIALSSRLRDELAATTVVVQASSPLEAQTLAAAATVMPTADGVSINGASTDGSFVMITGNIDVSEVDSLDDLTNAFALSPSTQEPSTTSQEPSTTGLPDTVPSSFDELENVPGNVTNEEDLEDYCLEHVDECMQWALEEGYLTAEDLAAYM
jgi:hypothetical protein